MTNKMGRRVDISEILSGFEISTLESQAPPAPCASDTAPLAAPGQRPQFCVTFSRSRLRRPVTQSHTETPWSPVHTIPSTRSTFTILRYWFWISAAELVRSSSLAVSCFSSTVCKFLPAPSVIVACSAHVLLCLLSAASAPWP